MSSPVRTPEAEASVRIFLSYASKDDALAYRLRNAVRQDHIQCFFAPEDIKRQQFWQPQLEEKIRKADLFLLLYTEAASNSEWVKREVRLANEAHLMIWAILDPKVPLTDFFKEQPFMARYQYYLHERNEPEWFTDVSRDLSELFPKAAGTIAERLLRTIARTLECRPLR